LFGILVLLLAGIIPVQAQDAASLTGTVVDARNDSRLVGASVFLRDASSTEVVRGTTADTDGTFQISEIAPGEYVLGVQFIGYKQFRLSLTLEPGESRDLTIELELESKSLETVVVSASRRQEKVLDAPSAISVVEQEQIRREVATSSVERLRSTPGVDMAQTGVDRREVALRGFNEAFASGIHVLTDYREAAVPALGVNAYSIMPSIPLDLRRVEVVRGPGSALYGPGVDSGVIHFFSKSPFRRPGTALSVAGGSRAFVNVQARQAGVVNDRIGYKLTAQFSRADEWELNPSNPQDAEEIDRYRIYQNPDEAPLEDRAYVTRDFDGDTQPEAQLRREDLYYKYNMNGMVEYRFGRAASLTANGGYSALKSTFQSGVGTIQTDGFGYSYGQLRLEAGDFFAQVYLNQNHAGSGTYVYGSGRSTADEGLQWNGQLQYSFDLSTLDTEVVTGMDADLLRPRTEGTVLGRNEGRDHIDEYGAYAQTTTEIVAPLSLTLAGRADYNNVVESLQLSPRAALVWNLTPDHSLRASYNQSFSSPSVNSLFLDIPAERRPVGTGQELVLQGRGAVDGFTFDSFRAQREAQSILPGSFGTSVPLSQYPVKPVYGAAAQEFADRRAADALTGPVADLSAAAQQSYGDLLSAVARETTAGQQTSPAGSEAGVVLGLPGDQRLGYRPITGPRDVAPLDQTTTRTYEMGYRGTVADRVRIRVSGYYEQKQEFVGPLQVESPFVYLTPSFVSSDLESKLQTDPSVQQAFDQFRQEADLSRARALEVLTGTVGSTPSAVVQPDQQVLSGRRGDRVGALLTYRNFGTVEYWGLDASIEADLTEQFAAFGNVSYVSDDFFTNEELDETDTSLSLALNAPAFKVKGGADYELPAGFSVGATAHYVDGFPVRTGPYVGSVDSYVLLDLRAGYEAPTVPGLTLTFTGKNVLDHRHREFVGSPPLGRMLMGRLTYRLP
jgi:iron complex outermembrane receptor protein